MLINWDILLVEIFERCVLDSWIYLQHACWVLELKLLGENVFSALGLTPKQLNICNVCTFLARFAARAAFLGGRPSDVKKLPQAVKKQDLDEKETKTIRDEDRNCVRRC